jgi:hypothetical protein
VTSLPVTYNEKSAVGLEIRVKSETQQSTLAVVPYTCANVQISTGDLVRARVHCADHTALRGHEYSVVGL